VLGLGLLVAIPSVVIAGPFLGHYMAKWVPITADSISLLDADRNSDELQKKPSFANAISVILLPVVLMLLATVVELLGLNESGFGQFIAFLGTPLIALLLTLIVGIFSLGVAQGHKSSEINGIFGKSIESIGGILLIVAAGGGFKQTLVDSGIDKVIASGISGSNMSPLLAGWLVAVLIRLATGSATVATVTASGLVAPLAAGMSPTHLALMVLAIGAGSIFLSHVNDAGFWLVKEYFGMSVKQTFMTWSLMETVLSVVGFVFVFLLSLVI
jgi:GntP family gluconate:H+ symporter